MAEMQKLDERSDGKYITRKVSFKALGSFKLATIETVFDFAYNMTFGATGEHRDHRSGGTHERKLGEIFANTFQGKLCEYAFYNTAHGELPLETPDVSTWELGKWDDTDFVVDGYYINIKSTKAFGNLLLLETKDWNANAQYIPNASKHDYDYFILIRLNPFCEDILKRNRILYTNDAIDKTELKRIITAEKWEYDIAGWCDRAEIAQVIKDKHIIKRGEMLNGNTKMDAENYYVQAGDMHPITELIKLLKNKKGGNA